ncbi:L-proline glycine betaine ABC transport system permease protein ProV [Marinobacterium lacunae]|uniref:L-proline glycine betaine ABC transport system permease protein ProV n=1 Tax=Marinobacterium lacunae TaxID=1232683 RepID=A0A081FYX0_9GAMM|nr:choline ABC transporter ATP-binding protein [Marinobacterium lacunae]KEA63725.1 L-proline glycine betaine ABC transport system permease protein ProV [Marinobacterium lacunae]
MKAVSIRNLDVVFGNNVAQTLKLLDNGQGRQQILEATGDVVGVHDASIDVEQGEICVLMGLSGSGKSSLLRAVNGLNPVSRGTLEVLDGERMVDLGRCDALHLRELRRKRISMVFQKFALMPWLSVVDNVAFGLEMQGIGKSERRKRALEKLDMVGLADWANKLPHELSGGMQQRVGLARAFAMDSDILLMDEPFSALDPLIRAQLQDELIALQRQLNKTILFVSHDLDEALKIGTNIAIMESARIIQHGKPEDIVLNPSNTYVEKFVAHTNPLNVLRGRSLMTGIAALQIDSDRLMLNVHDQSHVHISAGRPVSAQRGGQPLEIRQWQESTCIDEVGENMLIVANPDISMRTAIELRYRSGQPILLSEEDRLVGMLSDKDFYHALLGKHFTQSEAA